MTAKGRKPALNLGRCDKLRQGRRSRVILMLCACSAAATLLDSYSTTAVAAPIGSAGLEDDGEPAARWKQLLPSHGGCPELTLCLGTILGPAKSWAFWLWCNPLRELVFLVPGISKCVLFVTKIRTGLVCEPSSVPTTWPQTSPSISCRAALLSFGPGSVVSRMMMMRNTFPWTWF
ncbi:hypothetical protein B0J15DRAFT_2232 [Fusarium solani]|uniref:Uncharacterized protein n=1 Tax=Fusarium solani TaxID=169388 RepID=A0A9P9L6N0_FUSSL|nr:uncharacterized protein B0J15DRAFT_2232 [Fusarium solani]KAH7274976.1 hypothetical protein B0J15DRAFT_2232 [Fusarium solani]